MRIGYLECFSGISGDMLLGALVDAGVPFDTLVETAASLNIGARLEMRKVSRGGIAGTKLDVLSPGKPGAEDVHAHGDNPGRRYEQSDQSEHTHAPGIAHQHTHSHTHAHTHDDEHGHTHDHPVAGEPEHMHTH